MTRKLSRAVFESGKRSLPPQLSLMSGARRTRKAAPLSTRSASCRCPSARKARSRADALGPMYYGVSKYSAKPEVAADFVNFITGPDMQKKRALQDAVNPSIPALYSDADVLAKIPPSSRTTSRPSPTARCASAILDQLQPRLAGFLSRRPRHAVGRRRDQVRADLARRTA